MLKENYFNKKADFKGPNFYQDFKYLQAQFCPTKNFARFYSCNKLWVQMVATGHLPIWSMIILKWKPLENIQVLTSINALI